MIHHDLHQSDGPNSLTVGLKSNNGASSRTGPNKPGAVERVHRRLDLLFIGKRFAEQPQKPDQCFSAAEQVFNQPQGLNIRQEYRRLTRFTQTMLTES